MRLAEPWFLLLLPVVALLYGLYRRRRLAVRFPSLRVLMAPTSGRLARLRHLPFILRCVATAAVIIALARPQSGETHSERTAEGLDIVLILDTSRSMESRDYVWGNERPNRLVVVKRVINDFIAARPSDRIGIVVFGSEAFTQAPLTLDHQVLYRFIEHIQIGMAGDATAIGDGLITAINRLKPVQAKSKVAILLTDGGNNSGRTDPMAAAQVAATMGVKVYTIGVGANPPPGQAQGDFDLDEKALKDIAAATKGRYFRAADTSTLVNVYQTIDQLEKVKVTVDSYALYEEEFAAFVAVALACLALEVLLGLTRLRRLPT